MDIKGAREMIETKEGYCRRRVGGKSIMTTFLYWLIENKKGLQCYVHDGAHFMKFTPKEFSRFVAGPD